MNKKTSIFFQRMPFKSGKEREKSGCWLACTLRKKNTFILVLVLQSNQGVGLTIKLVNFMDFSHLCNVAMFH